MSDNLPENTTDKSISLRHGDYQAVPVLEIRRQVQAIQEVMKEVMKKDEHYGTIPGCGKKQVLFQSGAQKINMVFRFRPEIRIRESDLPNGHKTYDATVDIIHIPTGDIVGQGIGTCSTMESKYRYRIAAKKCPRCEAEAIIKGKAEYGGGWLCFKAKGGCGEKFDDNDKTITEQEVGRIEYEDPADYYNTCKKMAVKRAYVGGTLSATAASDIFTQDLDDDLSIEDAAIEAELNSGGTKNQNELNDYLNKISSFDDLAALEAWKTKNTQEIRKVLSGQGELFKINEAFTKKHASLVAAGLKEKQEDPEPKTETSSNDNESVEHSKLNAAIEFVGENVYHDALQRCGYERDTIVAHLDDEQCIKVSEMMNSIVDED